MRARMRVLILWLAVAVLGLAGCDSGGGGGGGAVAFTQAMLAGTWHYTEERPGGVVWKGEITIDANGQVTKWKIDTVGRVIWNLQGRLTVHGDGRVEGKIVDVFTIMPQVYELMAIKWNLRFKTAHTLSGDWSRIQTLRIFGVNFLRDVDAARVWLTAKK